MDQINASDIFEIEPQETHLTDSELFDQEYSTFIKIQQILTDTFLYREDKNIHEQNIQRIPGNMLMRIGQPVPGVWDEMGRRARAIQNSSGDEYAFVQAVGIPQAMFQTVQQMIATIDEFRANADKIRQGINHLLESADWTPWRNELEQTLVEMDRLLMMLSEK